MVAFYRILERRFNRSAAFWAVALVALWPPLWAHAHVNSKDVVFLSLQVLAVSSLIRYREGSGSRTLHFWLFALLSAWAASIRLVGVCLLGLAPLLLARAGFKEPGGSSQRASRRPALALLGASALLLILSFPVLWSTPWNRLGEMLGYATQNPWPNPSLFLGQPLYPESFTRWYLPIWMLFTLPLGLLFLAAWGSYLGIKAMLGHKGLSFSDALFLGWFCLPFLLVLALNPVLYNNWRHFYFLVIPLAYVSAFGIQEWKARLGSKKLNWLLGIYTLNLGLSALIQPGLAAVRMNDLYSKVVQVWVGESQAYMTQDYWGLCTQDALKKLDQTAPQKQLKIACKTELVELSSHLWPLERVVQVPIERARYYFDFNREGSWSWPELGYQEEGLGLLLMEFHNGSESVLRVYDLQQKSEKIQL
jgi:4-amino-4-deoxy-L-arabinose transferase-like glycosyltransferase